MANELWLNLPVKDVGRSKTFFSGLGFKLNPRHEGSDDAAGYEIGGMMVMLFPEATFRGFTGHAVSDTKLGSEVLISIGAESREEVDELVRRAEEAGAEIYGRPSEVGGYMYGAGFADLDGHRWNLLYMDKSKIPD